MKRSMSLSNLITKQTVAGKPIENKICAKLFEISFKWYASTPGQEWLTAPSIPEPASTTGLITSALSKW